MRRHFWLLTHGVVGATRYAIEVARNPADQPVM